MRAGWTGTPTGSLPWTRSAPGCATPATPRSLRHSAGTRSRSSAAIALPDIIQPAILSIALWPVRLAHGPFRARQTLAIGYQPLVSAHPHRLTDLPTYRLTH